MVCFIRKELLLAERNMEFGFAEGTKFQVD
jgi:hypothetical protein